MMMLYLCGALSGVWISLMLVVFFMWYQRRSAPVEIKQKPVEYETYGHYTAPVPLLRKSLPRAPLGTSWEIVVKYDSAGESWLHLMLLNLGHGNQVIAEDRVNLIYREPRYDGTWASLYREAPAYAKSRAYDKIIGRLVDFATVTANQYSLSGSIRDYTTTEGGES